MITEKTEKWSSNRVSFVADNSDQPLQNWKFSSLSSYFVITIITVIVIIILWRRQLWPTVANCCKVIIIIVVVVVILIIIKIIAICWQGLFPSLRYFHHDCDHELHWLQSGTRSLSLCTAMQLCQPNRTWLRDFPEKEIIKWIEGCGLNALSWVVAGN